MENSNKCCKYASNIVQGILSSYKKLSCKSEMGGM